MAAPRISAKVSHIIQNFQTGNAKSLSFQPPTLKISQLIKGTTPAPLFEKHSKSGVKILETAFSPSVFGYVRILDGRNYTLYLLSL